MPKLIIDNIAVEVDEGISVLEAAQSVGIPIPHFCWHPALGSVGSCRQCAVKRFEGADDEQGKLVMACMTPAAEGTRISITDPEAAAFRSER